MEMKLMTLTLDNFKHFDHREFRFEGESAALYGENGTGKTTVYDAFTWLLFGKDSQGNGNPDIKPHDENHEIRDRAAVTGVEAQLLVDGVPRSLKRTYYEVWSVKRGTGEAASEGHTSDFFVDGVPVKKGEFSRRVGEIISEDRFKLLTGLSTFSRTLHWQDRRALLFDLAGVGDDAWIMDSDPRFAPLAQALGGQTLEDLRRKLDARRKALNGVRSDIPARLDECGRTVEELAGIDFAALETRRSQVEARRDRARAGLDRSRQAGTEAGGAVAELRTQLSELLAANQAHRTAQRHGDTRAQAQALQQGIAALTASGKRRQRDLAYLRERLTQLDGQIDTCRRRWDEIDGEVFTGGVCPACGQALPADRLEAARAAFEEDKTRGKAAAVAQADAAKARRREITEDMERMEQEEAAEDGQLAQLKAQLAQSEGQAAPQTQDLPDYGVRRAALEQRLEEARRELEEEARREETRRSALREEVRLAEEELNALSGELARKSVLDRTRRRMDELREQAARAGEELAAVDRMISLCEEFIRYKARFVEDSVNRRFELVKFRLFREQVNGGLADCCDVLVGGSLVGSGANTGAEYQAGVDIINTLSRHYDAWVPLFVDNAESVTGPLEAKTQMIRLVVSPADRELRFDREEHRAAADKEPQSARETRQGRGESSRGEANPI